MALRERLGLSPARTDNVPPPLPIAQPRDARRVPEWRRLQLERLAARGRVAEKELDRA